MEQPRPYWSYRCLCVEWGKENIEIGLQQLSIFSISNHLNPYQSISTYLTLRANQTNCKIDNKSSTVCKVSSVKNPETWPKKPAPQKDKEIGLIMK